MIAILKPIRANAPEFVKREQAMTAEMETAIAGGDMDAFHRARMETDFSRVMLFEATKVGIPSMEERRAMLAKQAMERRRRITERANQGVALTATAMQDGRERT